MKKPADMRSAEPATGAVWRARAQGGAASGCGASEWLDLAGVAFVLFDPGLRIEDLSPGAGPLLGLTEAAIGGEGAECLRPLGGGTLIEGLRATVTGRSPSQHELTSADGRRFLVRILPRPAHNGGGRGALVTFVDVSEPGAPATGPGDSDQTNLIAIASHDLRQPLQSISLLNAALQQVSDDDRVRKIVRLQREALDQVSDVLETLLDLSTLNSGAVRPAPVRFPVARILDHLRADYRQQAATKALDFGVRHSDDAAECDQLLLTQLLDSLVANAIHSTTEGFVRLWCWREPGHLAIALEYSPGVGDPESPNEGSGLEPIIARRIARLLAIPIETRRTSGEALRVVVRVPAPEAGVPG